MTLLGELGLVFLTFATPVWIASGAFAISALKLTIRTTAVPERRCWLSSSPGSSSSASGSLLTKCALGLAVTNAGAFKVRTWNRPSPRSARRTEITAQAEESARPSRPSDSLARPCRRRIGHCLHQRPAIGRRLCWFGDRFASRKLRFRRQTKPPPNAISPPWPGMPAEASPAASRYAHRHERRTVALVQYPDGTGSRCEKARLGTDRSRPQDLLVAGSMRRRDCRRSM